MVIALSELDWARKIYAVSPAVALTLADHEGRRKLRRMRKGRLNAVPRLEELELLFGPGLREEREAVQERAAACQARNYLIATVSTARGLDSLQRRLEIAPETDAIVEQLRRGGRGVIVTTLHGGPKAGVWAYVQRLGVPVLKIQNHTWSRMPVGWELAYPSGDAAQGLKLLRHARRHLSKGGWVGTAVDDFKSGTRRRTVRCLGHEMSLATGVVSMAVMTGAPLVLIGARWSDTGRRIRIEAQPPIHPESTAGMDHEAAEAALIGQLGERMEGFLARYPWEFTGNHLRRLLRGAPLGNAADAPQAELCGTNTLDPE